MSEAVHVCERQCVCLCVRIECGVYVCVSAEHGMCVCVGQGTAWCVVCVCEEGQSMAYVCGGSRYLVLLPAAALFLAPRRDVSR